MKGLLGIPVIVDNKIEEINLNEYDSLVIPGGYDRHLKNEEFRVYG